MQKQGSVLLNASGMSQAYVYLHEQGQVSQAVGCRRTRQDAAEWGRMGAEHWSSLPCPKKVFRKTKKIADYWFVIAFVVRHDDRAGHLWQRAKHKKLALKE